MNKDFDSTDRTPGEYYVDLDRDTVQRSPEYEPDVEISRAYETKLFQHL